MIFCLPCFHPGSGPCLAQSYHLCCWDSERSRLHEGPVDLRTQPLHIFEGRADVVVDDLVVELLQPLACRGGRVALPRLGRPWALGNPQEGAQQIQAHLHPFRSVNQQTVPCSCTPVNDGAERPHLLGCPLRTAWLPSRRWRASTAATALVRQSPSGPARAPPPSPFAACSGAATLPQSLHLTSARSIGHPTDTFRSLPLRALRLGVAFHCKIRRHWNVRCSPAKLSADLLPALSPT